MSTSRNVIPTEDEVRKAAIELKKGNPTSGVAKIHSLLLGANLSWTKAGYSLEQQRRAAITTAPGQVRPSLPGAALGSWLGTKSRCFSSLDLGLVTLGKSYQAKPKKDQTWPWLGI
ncbi:hypothetical protein P692DRAFT_201808927 [Suillus brevipes Sb2]|nr:hypothetical protein P692DRAFT_201808927 [Suillus brevipes Sb2]